MAIARRSFLATASVAVAASLPGCTLMSPAAASISKGSPRLPVHDPLAALIAEYRARLAEFQARAATEEWDALFAATYGPPLEALWHATPEPTSPAGLAAGLALALEEPDLYAVTPVLRACLRFLERGAQS